MKRLFLNLLIITILIFSNSMAQQETPINSNYLIEHGVSPRILDAAATPFMQDGSFSESLVIDISKSGQNKKYELELIYDPDYEEGMDIRLINKSEKLEKDEIKKITKFIEKSHYFSRMSRNYLYDESTLKQIKTEGDTVAFEFFYQKADIDPYLKVIKKLKGYVYFVKGNLDKVVLENTKPLSGDVIKYQKVVRYTKPTVGGYIINFYKEILITEDGTKVEISSSTFNYVDANGESLVWENKPEQETKVAGDTIVVNLGGTLPFLGKEATKLGYQLPRPVGVDVFTHLQSQYMEFTGLAVGVDKTDLTDLQDLFILDESEVTLVSTITMAKADVWIFPFLNLTAIVGAGNNKLEGDLVINNELRDFFEKLPGWIIDVPNIPKSIPINTNITSEIYGGGATLAGGVGNFNLSINYQLMFTRIVEANTTNMVNIITPMLGYMSPFGVNFMLGAQGQFYNTKVNGYIEFDDKNGQHHKLNYKVDFKPVQWNVMFGLYKVFSKHWEMSLQTGFGDRTSITAIFGYRF
jgi:hypothetical protein